MATFLLYLIESGLCLILLYLAYWLFLRKETYFNFNRIFLVGSIVLALSVPLLHLNFSIRENSSLEGSAEKILQFRNYYLELVAIIDADFGTEPSDYDGNLPDDLDYQSLTGLQEEQEMVNRESRWSVSRILLIVYLGGVLYFFIRFFYLILRLINIARTNGINHYDGFRMVEMKEDISPFSFFRFLYINREGLAESELENILMHEKAHIRQQHTFDHLFAHGLAVFQWFNPFAWQIRNALKTTHEYIADRQVLDQGFKLFDYQSLLLKQVIGYHSVELVNNFNLKPIKKRITMMTKMKSGIPAKMKAMLIIPVALIVFLLFADFTLKGPGSRILDLNTRLIETKSEKSLAGLWERNMGTSAEEIHDPFGLVYISTDKFSYLHDLDQVREYFWRLENDNLILSGEKGGQGTDLKIDIDDDVLTIWWSDAQFQIYRKTDAGNTLDLALSKTDLRIELPVVSQFRILELNMTYGISLGFEEEGRVGLRFNGQPVTIDDLPGRIEEYKSHINKLDQSNLTALFRVDKQMPMGEVVKVKQKLREIGSLKIADAGYPHETGGFVSPLIYARVALPRLLPPMDAKILDKEDVKREGISIFEIDLSARNTTPADIERDLIEFIQRNSNSDYVYSLEYDKDISYRQYLETVDMVFNVVYRFRDELARERYNIPYVHLGEGLQKEIRSEFPMVLSEAWSGI